MRNTTALHPRPRPPQRSRRKLAALLITLALSLPLGSNAGVLRIAGEGFLLDGKPFDMWGIRVAGAANTEELTTHLVAQLDEYKAHGVNTVAVFYQGCSGKNLNPFSEDGKSIDPKIQTRIEQIIRECDLREMVVVVGIFYQRAPLPFRDATVVREVVRTVTRALKPHRNVIINIANEQNSGGWEDTASLFDFRDPQNIIALCQEIKAIDPDRIAGGGGYDNAKNIVIGLAPEVDVLLWDTNSGRQDAGKIARSFREAGVVEKPLVNVELYGGWTRKFEPRGVFPEDARAPYLRDVGEAAGDSGLYVFFHDNPWCQGPDTKGDMRFNLGGNGSPESPGIRWYFELVRDARANAGKGEE